MDLQAALQAGKLLQHAYDDDNLPNYDGKTYEGFNVLQTIYSDDLATDISPNIDPVRDVVSIGYVAQSIASPDEYVIAVRGTEGTLEWVQDAKFLPRPFSAVPGAGLTEDGFTDMYDAFRVGVDPKSARLTPTLTSLLGNSASKLTICGHSLGSALATMLALDVAVNTPYKQPRLITFASPRVGDPHFANYFNAVVPECYRIANRIDVVAHLPWPPLYIHVGDDTELNPAGTVRDSLVCQHKLATYMFLLTQGAIPPFPQCAL
jgi:predicted lipase